MNVNLTPPAEREFPAVRLEQRKQQLLARIEAELPVKARRPLLRRRLPIAAIAVAAAAAVAVGVTMLLPGKNDGLSSAGRYVHRLPRVSTSVSGEPNRAAVVLLRAARTAARRPATAAPGPGQFIYTKLERLDTTSAGSDAIAFRQHTIENWSSPDGSGHYVDAEGHMLFPTAADATYFYEHYPLSLIEEQTADQTFGAGPPNYDELSTVPTDPAQLKQLIENRTLEGGPPGDAETFQIIRDLLNQTGAPPAVRSALYTIASELPGVELVGPTHDELGRPGIGVAYLEAVNPKEPAYGELRDELIFDPQTSGLLGEQVTVVQRSEVYPFAPGTVVGWTVYLASGIVNSDTDTTTSTP